MAALQSIALGTARATGKDFFPTLVRHLAHAAGVHHVFVAELVPPQTVRTLAYWSRGNLSPNIEYELPGTPCAEVIRGEPRHYASGLQQRFPGHWPGMESYLGIPLAAQDGAVLGALCAIDEAPLPADPGKLLIFQIFAAAAAAELDRLRAEKNHRESEERFRDLFDEAPIAYVHEGLDSRFLRANRAAMRTLGIKPEEVEGTYGLHFIPKTPDARRRFDEAFASIGKGTDTSGLVLELERKDDGRPIFIQWWSKPDPGGAYTRTMFVDITERVLLEKEQKKLQAQNLYLQEEIKAVHNFEEIVGASGGLLKVLEDVQRVARTDATVLLLGETGTGKELIARAIHSTSSRADKPFIKINCAALPAGLVESELFGHERGAFSGAIQRRIGRFELADKGTIFLDEIGEVPLAVQVKLLRVLQEHEFERVGGNHTLKVDVRVIAATNRDLVKGMREGSFREDLFYRLNVFPLNLPALRDRSEDIPLLVQFFAQKYAPRVGRRIDGVDADTLRQFARYPWPGNIRELENIVERALILATSPVLRIEPGVMASVAPLMPTSHTPIEAGVSSTPETPPTAAHSSSEDLRSVQRDHILNVLSKTNWVVEGAHGAALQLGLKPGTLRHKIKQLGISRDARRRT